MTKILTWFFLRLYASNLERSFRASKEKAFDDAIYTFTLAIAILSGTLVGLLSLLFLGRNEFLRYAKFIFLSIGFLFAVPIMSWFEYWLKGFRENENATLPFRSRSERLKTSVLYFGIGGCCVCALLSPIFFH